MLIKQLLRSSSIVGFVSLLGLASVVPAQAAHLSQNQSTEGGTNGVGVILGEPTGFTGKFWLSSDRAVDAGLAFSLSDFVLLYGDYLFHFPGAFGRSNAFLHQLTPYVGLGAELFVSENTANTNGKYFTANNSSVDFGVRIPLGIEWKIPRSPVGVFVELVPGLGLLPGTFGFFQGGIGARFYF